MQKMQKGGRKENEKKKKKRRRKRRRKRKKARKKHFNPISLFSLSCFLKPTTFTSEVAEGPTSKGCQEGAGV